MRVSQVSSQTHVAYCLPYSSYCGPYLVPHGLTGLEVEVGSVSESSRFRFQSSRATGVDCVGPSWPKQGKGQ